MAKTTTENTNNKSRGQDQSRWADVSLSANATDLLRSHSSNKRRNASAPANTSAREEVTRMQQALLSARYHFLSRDERPLSRRGAFFRAFRRLRRPESLDSSQCDKSTVATCFDVHTLNADMHTPPSPSNDPHAAARGMCGGAPWPKRFGGNKSRGAPTESRARCAGTWQQVFCSKLSVGGKNSSLE